MSITIAGKLTVIERNGRNGTFTVGELITEIGTFKLKNRVLDQFPEGSYEGVFYITRIYNQSNFSKGQVWVSLYADLDWEALQILAQNHQEIDVPASLEASAIIEADAESTTNNSHVANPQVDLPLSPVSSEPTHSIEQSEFTDSDDGLIDSMEKLQKSLENNATSIKIDASLDDRNLFRQLRESIKAQGYQFQATTQSWIKKS